MANSAIFKVVFVDLIAAADVKVSSGGSEKQSGFQWMKAQRDKRMNEWMNESLAQALSEVKGLTGKRTI